MTTGEITLTSVLSTIREALVPADGTEGMDEDEQAAFFFTLYLFAQSNLELKWPNWKEDVGFQEEGK